MTGKSYLLWYLLIRLLMDGRDAIFIFRCTGVYFRGLEAWKPLGGDRTDTLRNLPQFSAQEPVFTLVDWDDCATPFPLL